MLFSEQAKLLHRMGRGYYIPNMRYGTMWRRRHHAFHEHFHANTVHKYLPIQVKETQAFLRRLLTTLQNFMHHIRQ